MWNKKEMGQLDATLTVYILPWPLILTFDLEFSKSNHIFGVGGPIVMERNVRGQIGCPDMKH